MKIIRFLVGFCTLVGFAVVVAYLAAMRFVGESTWQTTVLLYLPHGLLLVPLVGLALLLVLVGPRRLLIVDLASILIVLFPIMECNVGSGAIPTGAHLRLLTYNVDSGKRSVPEIVAQITEVAPDVVLLQETGSNVNDAVAAALPGFSFHTSTQFFLASRFPIVDVELPPKISAAGKDRSPRFLRYTLDTTLGLIDVLNVHPISPRDGFEDIRGAGLSREIESGRVFAGDRHALTANTALRRAQVTAVAETIHRATHPVLVGGDTNLPGGSGMLREAFRGMDDAFAEVNSGFGYTFPSHRYVPWMRIDRIFAGPGLRFLHAEVGTRRGSDHYCLFVDVERR